MLRRLGTLIVISFAAAWLLAMPSVLPHVFRTQTRLADLLHRTARAIDASAWVTQTELARIEDLAAFPEDDLLRRLARSVGMLRITLTDTAGKTITFLCTATLIARDTVLTNQHCIEKQASTDRVTLELWLDHVGEAATIHPVDPLPLEEDGELDYAVLRLARSPEMSLPLPWPRFQLRAAVTGERLFILHHSGGNPLQVTRAHCRVTAPDATRRTVVRHSCATQTGSSGALLIAERDHAIVGLHRAIRRSHETSRGIATAATVLHAKSTVLSRPMPK